jgi:hypothetical protein
LVASCVTSGGTLSPESGLFGKSRHTGPIAALAVTLVLLHGIVMRGPITPVCRTGMPCNEPAVGAVLAFSRNGRVAVRVRVGRAGRYSVRLAAGIYSVRQAPAPKVGFGIRPDVVRVRGVSTRADFFVDTGIR